MQVNAILKRLLSFSLPVLLILPNTVFGAPPVSLRPPASLASPKTKLAPDLVDLLTQDDEDQRQSLQGKTLAQVRQERLARMAQQAAATGEAAPERKRIGERLLPSPSVLAEEKQSFLVQLSSSIPPVVLQETLTRLGGTMRQTYASSGLITIDAPRNVMRQLAAQGSVTYISPDRALQASGHVEDTTGTTQIRSLVSATPFNGAGIGIAVLDSGVDDAHHLHAKSDTHPGIVYKKDFTGLGVGKDNFAHGTHVAGLAAGNASAGPLTSGAYRGIAPNADLISLRVLDENGQGAASAVIAAVDWCILNKTQYNIRVINLSLGTYAKDSYRNDPLCLAARRAVNAGIVVVAAAGNDGKDGNGNKIYGGIHSPGIDPSVITVGASNTFGTANRSDDAVTTFSSRGPTRGYTTDEKGIRHYDNLIKPDLVAPGNRLINASSTNGGKRNYLEANYPHLLVKGSEADKDQTLYLSGTSMATPIVAGAAALLLQAKPNLPPNLVKAILMYTAQPLKGFNMLEQGAGELNVEGAVRIANLVHSTLPTTNGASLLTAPLPTPQSTIAGETFTWGQGVITNWGFLYGSNLMTTWQDVYRTGVALADTTGRVNGTLSILSGEMASKVNFYPEVVNITINGVALADGMLMSDGMLLSDSIALADGVLMGDGIMMADGAYLGDNTACMLPTR